MYLAGLEALRMRYRLRTNLEGEICNNEWHERTV